MTLLADIRRRIVAPVVLDLDLPGDATARIQLATGIGNVESGYRALAQTGGPALGFWQMEPATHDDCWTNYLNARPALAAVIKAYLPTGYRGVPHADALVESLPYAAAMSIVSFRRAPIEVPARGDALGQCLAWKRGYNTRLGAGAADAAHVTLFQEAINA